MEELVELALKKIDMLEKKLEKYVEMLKADNEVDFILKGSYFTQEELSSVIMGN